MQNYFWPVFSRKSLARVADDLCPLDLVCQWVIFCNCHPWTPPPPTTHTPAIRSGPCTYELNPPCKRHVGRKVLPQCQIINRHFVLNHSPHHFVLLTAVFCACGGTGVILRRSSNRASRVRRKKHMKRQSFGRILRKFQFCILYIFRAEMTLKYWIFINWFESLIGNGKWTEIKSINYHLRLFQNNGEKSRNFLMTPMNAVSFTGTSNLVVKICHHSHFIRIRCFRIENIMLYKHGSARTAKRSPACKKSVTSGNAIGFSKESKKFQCNLTPNFDQTISVISSHFDTRVSPLRLRQPTCGNVSKTATDLDISARLLEPSTHRLIASSNVAASRRSVRSCKGPGWEKVQKW